MEVEFAKFNPLKSTDNPYETDLKNLIDFYQDNSVLQESNRFYESLQESMEPENTTISINLPPAPKIKPQVKDKLTFKANWEKDDIIEGIENLSIEEDDKKYLLKLAELESSYNPYIRNQYGYYGLFQFGPQALQQVNYNENDFDNVYNQFNAALSLAKFNETSLQDIINKYEGTYIDGIPITKNSIRAASHLLGASATRAYFEGLSGTYTDRNGTHITKYLVAFA